MAEILSFACPNCGSPVRTTGKEKEAKCDYCGSTVIVPEALRNQNQSPLGGKTGGSSTAKTVLILVLACVILGVIAGGLFFVFNITRSSTQTNSGAIVAIPTDAGVPTIATPPPTDTPAPTDTLVPTDTPAVINTPVPFTRVLFQDNFMNPSSGWSTVNSSDYVLEYKNGKFHIFVNKQGGGQATWISNSFKDVSVEVDVQETAGPSDGIMGVSCRNSDNGEMYAFEFSQDGYYGIYKYYSDGSYDVLDEGNLDTSILNAGGTNHVEGACVGETLTLVVNGQVVSQTQESSYTSGGTGLIAQTGSSGKPGLDVLFSNYVVKGN